MSREVEFGIAGLVGKKREATTHLEKLIDLVQDHPEALREAQEALDALGATSRYIKEITDATGTYNPETVNA